MTDDELNDLYVKNFNLVLPYLNLEGHTNKLDDTSEEGQNILKQGLDGFNLLLQHVPTNWSVLWLLGKIHQSLREHEKSYESFLNAHRNVLTEQNIMRELALECLYTKRFSQAVYYCDAAMKFDFEDLTLWSNMAICQLMNANIDEAEKWAKKTLNKNKDELASKVLLFVEEIRLNKRSIPDDFKKLENEL